MIDLRYCSDPKGIDLDEVDLMAPVPETEPNRQYYFMAKLKKWVTQKKEELGRTVH